MYDQIAEEPQWFICDRTLTAAAYVTELQQCGWSSSQTVGYDILSCEGMLSKAALKPLACPKPIR